MLTENPKITKKERMKMYERPDWSKGFTIEEFDKHFGTGSFKKNSAEKEDPLSVQYGGSHYKTKGIQPIEYILENNLSFVEGCIVKYITRWKDKGGIEDLEKIKHYCDFLIKYEKEKGY